MVAECCPHTWSRDSAEKEGMTGAAGGFGGRGSLGMKMLKKGKKCKSRFKAEVELSQGMEMRTTTEPDTACCKPRH